MSFLFLKIILIKSDLSVTTSVKPSSPKKQILFCLCPHGTMHDIASQLLGLVVEMSVSPSSLWTPSGQELFYLLNLWHLAQCLTIRVNWALGVPLGAIAAVNLWPKYIMGEILRKKSASLSSCVHSSAKGRSPALPVLCRKRTLSSWVGSPLPKERVNSGFCISGSKHPNYPMWKTISARLCF